MLALFEATDELSFCLKCRFPLMRVAGKYEIRKQLAEGGFATVYLAHHVELDRDPERVIKILKPEVFKLPKMGERFRREVQVTSALSQNNDHIVRIFDDFGEIPNLGHFYVMEYLHGKPLSDLIHHKAKLPGLKLCLFLFGQLCDAMEAAHREGIVHRDLKPDNLFITRRPELPYFLKVLDFGIAKPTDLESIKTTQLTQGTLGTPPYMSPEQCADRELDHRSDIYSMGIILYEMLVGHTPFLSEKQPRSMLNLIQAHVHETPPSPRRLRPDRDIPEALEAIVLRALEKHPKDRFPSALTFKNALFEAVPTHAPPKDLQQPSPPSPRQETMAFPLKTPSSMAYLETLSSEQIELETSERTRLSDAPISPRKTEKPQDITGRSPSFDSLPAINEKDARRFHPDRYQTQRPAHAKTTLPIKDNPGESQELDLSFRPSHAYRRPLVGLLFMAILSVLLVYNMVRVFQRVQTTHHAPKDHEKCGPGVFPQTNSLRVLLLTLLPPAPKQPKRRPEQQPLNQQLAADLWKTSEIFGKHLIRIRHSPLHWSSHDPQYHRREGIVLGQRCKADLVISAALMTSSTPGQGKSATSIKWLRLFVTYTGPSLTTPTGTKMGIPAPFDELAPTDADPLPGPKLRALIRGLIYYKAAKTIEKSPMLSTYLYHQAAQPLQKAGFGQLTYHLQKTGNAPILKLYKRPEVYIPAGPFYIGPPEKMKRKELPAFWIDKWEVNRENYAICVLRGHCPVISRFLNGEWSLPRDRVNLNAAKKYCAFQGKQLPTKEQWVKAARGGITIGKKPNPHPKREYPWGITTPSCKQANFKWCQKIKDGKDDLPIQLPTQQALEDISPYGVFQLAGNVGELLRDGKIKGASGFSDARPISWTGKMDQRKGLSWVGFRCVRKPGTITIPIQTRKRLNKLLRNGAH
tara:strand:- start:7256 stop:10009 length:2754 start_codon:yes stop_codon:yes gene_type:complete